MKMGILTFIFVAGMMLALMMIGRDIRILKDGFRACRDSGNTVEYCFLDVLP